MNLHTGWPWIGLGIAPLLLARLFFTGAFRRDGVRGVVWYAWLLLPIYMLHQFEEHGIDLLGRHYAFRETMCATVGFSSVATCPLPEAFFTAVNLAAVWGAALLSALAGAGRPLLALIAWGIAAVNGVTHVLGAIAQRGYNPGLATSVLLLLPLSIFAVRRALTTPGVGPGGVARMLAAGVLVHVVLLGSIRLFVSGAIGETALIAINIANGLTPAAVAYSSRGAGSSPQRRL